jgi:hypothetical protein
MKVIEINQTVWDMSRKFDLDIDQHDIYDDARMFIDENVMQKTLENDEIIYVEGFTRQSKNMLSKEDFEEEKANHYHDDTISAADFDYEFDKKLDIIEDKLKPDLGIFDKTEYFTNIFPKLRVQKPGDDFYGSTTMIIGLVFLYVFIFYKKYTFSPEVFDFYGGQSQLFKGEMSITLIVILIVLIIERYASRTDTKAQIFKRKRTHEYHSEMVE